MLLMHRAGAMSRQLCKLTWPRWQLRRRSSLWRWMPCCGLGAPLASPLLAMLWTALSGSRCTTCHRLLFVTSYCSLQWRTSNLSITRCSLSIRPFAFHSSTTLHRTAQLSSAQGSTAQQISLSSAACNPLLSSTVLSFSSALLQL